MYDVDATELIDGIAEELKKVEAVKPPEWAIFVKTGVHKERPPVREDWWYVRAASVLRKVRLMGPIGVSKLRTLYGGKQSRGYKGEVFKRASGNIIRKILQQLQKAELIKQGDKGVHKGRVATPKGIKFIDDIAKKIGGNRPVEKKEEKPKEVPKKEQPKPAEKPKTTNQKTEELVKKTKEFSQGKTPTAEKLIEEVKKEKPKEKKENKKPIEKANVPKAEELANKKKEKNG